MSGSCTPGCACVCHQQPPTPVPPQDPVSGRTAIIAVIAFLAGVVSGALTYWAYWNIPGAVLAGLGTMAVAFLALHNRGH
ncbi:hypothetical protein BCF44_13842 [Kutzneria buriramensis]|uniref:Uncharacterized protein n=1 Tax=Kutzneria buriramensis TaxID=1045776 RepID=A0A3E0G623_9PSEU|nr:hypothetical protein BCF44_13842 [Kutzneria buriramensis]